MASESRAPAIIAGNLIPFVVTTPFVVGRFYSRAVILHGFQLDDWILVVAWLAALVNVILCTVAVRYGAGHHQAVIPESSIVPFFQTQFSDLLVYQVAVTMTKVSLCVMYLRIFGTSRGDKFFLWAINTILITSLVGLELFNIFRCKPLSKVYDPSEDGKCQNTTPGFYVSVGISLFTDIALIAYSAYKVFGLQMRLRQKLTLMSTVGISWVVVIAAIVRAVKIHAVIKNSTDSSWRAYDTSIWSSVEINVALLCTAAPAVKPLLQKLAPTFMYSLSGKTGSRTAGQTSKRGTGAVATNTFQSRIATRITQNDDKDNDETGIFKSTQITITEQHHEDEAGSETHEMTTFDRDMRNNREMV